MPLKMRFLEGTFEDNGICYPVSSAKGIYLKNSTQNVQDFIDDFNNNIRPIIEGEKEISLSDSIIHSNHILNGAITNDKIADIVTGEDGSETGGISGSKIQTASITDAKILPYRLKEGSTTEYVGGLSGDKIKNGAITRNKIANSVFTPELIGRTVSTNFSDNESWDISQFSWIILCIGTIDETAPESNEYHTRILSSTLIPVCLMPDLQGTETSFNNSQHAAGYFDGSAYLYAAEAKTYLDNGKTKCQIRVVSRPLPEHQEDSTKYGSEAFLFGIR